MAATDSNNSRSTVAEVQEAVGGRSWPLPGEGNHQTRLSDVYVPNGNMGFYKDPCFKISQIVDQGVIAANRAVATIDSSLDKRIETAVAKAFAANDARFQQLVAEGTSRAYRPRNF